MFTPQHRPYISLALTCQALSTWPKLLFTDWRKPGIGYARYCNGVWQIHWHFFLGHHAQRHWPLVLPWSQLSFMVTTILLLATRRTRPFVVLSCLIHKASLPCMMAEDKKKHPNRIYPTELLTAPCAPCMALFLRVWSLSKRRKRPDHNNWHHIFSDGKR